jgi:ribosomal protein S18 acetylase RimI-like enzyme
MNAKITIQELRTRSELKDFVTFAIDLYKGNTYYVPPIIESELDTLDPAVNPIFKDAEARYFVALQGGKIVGRIASLINHIEISQLGKKRMRFGWFDAIDQPEVSQALLEQVIAIGKEKKMDTVEGPMGFSNLDKAGLLIKGFEERSTMITWYNAPYYAQHLEQLGFKKQAEWVEFEIEIKGFEESPEKVKRFSELILDRYALKLLKFDNNKAILPYVDQMFELLGKTYDRLQTFVPIQDYQIAHYKDQFIRFVNPEFIKCVTNAQGELIAFAITMPSFSQALQKAKGHLYPFGIFHLLWARKYSKRASFYLIGIRPDYQNKGVTAIIFNEMQKTFNKYGIKKVETNPELEENQAIQKLWKNYNHREHKRRATFYKPLG